ncbi:helix-turn-helix domain-containing protein [Tumebacillus permanentifrigoris]|uniref:Uncharacterized protein n=1 Tax=Tumebacillus permanentifrigoris TaxID=378543 RepID=A0A316DDI9_9BACL|nr:helix-turn-helix domain-containing protein [Tumebacillus permanentifrigoris]PWK16045.1 hypothetical protein C7459_102292 [Tumebacillus permanentifrigoris]
MEEYTVEQAFEILKKHGITESIQTVRRWLREGTLIGQSPGDHRQIGWKVNHDDLMAFIATRQPVSAFADIVEGITAELGALRNENNALRTKYGQLFVANQKLVEEIAVLKSEKERLRVKTQACDLQETNSHLKGAGPCSE